MKSFIYVDEYKLKSIASQVFEGFTEYIIDTKHRLKESSSEQKSAISNSRLIAEILKQQNSIQEKKHLLDYGYDLLEKELYRTNKVLEINSNNLSESHIEIPKFNFVNVRGPIIINDTRHMSNLVENFNKIGEALGYLTYKDQLDKIAELDKEINQVKDRNKKAKLKKQWTKSSKTAILKELGLYLEQAHLDNLKQVIDFGYLDQIEVQMPIYMEDSFKLFSSILKREFLREPEQILIQKYSRETEKEFNVFGLMAQNERTEKDIKPSEKFKQTIESNLVESGGELGMKQAIMNVTNAISNIEDTFSGKLDYEIVIDPIAVYWNLDK